MLVVLRKNETEEIASAMLINVYDLEYYGVKTWATIEEANAEKNVFLASNELGLPGDWQAIAAEDHKVKIMNVKLNNNPSRRVKFDSSGSVELMK